MAGASQERGTSPGNCPSPNGGGTYEFSKVDLKSGPMVICEMGPFDGICGATQGRGALCLQLFPREIRGVVPSHNYSAITVPGEILYDAGTRLIVASPFPRLPETIKPLSRVAGTFMTEFMADPDSIVTPQQLWKAAYPNEEEGEFSRVNKNVQQQVFIIRNALGSQDPITGLRPKDVLTTIRPDENFSGGYMLQLAP